MADLCFGSGTTLEAAQRLGCRFAGLDVNPEAAAIALSRLEPENKTVICPCGKGKAELVTEESEGRFRMGGIRTENPAFPASATPADNLEAWETGRIEDGIFYPDQTRRRSFRYPELVMSLKADPESIRAVMTTDAAGIRRAFRRE